MPALAPGTKAPGFNLQNLKPGEKAVVAFFKATCPTCMLAFPYLERLYKHHQGDAQVKFIAVAQEDANGAEGFKKSYNLTMPITLDQKPYPVSNQYGLTNVPTVFIVGADGQIEQTTIGFSKAEYLKMTDDLSKLTQKKPAPIFDGVTVPDFKPG